MKTSQIFIAVSLALSVSAGPLQEGAGKVEIEATKAAGVSTYSIYGTTISPIEAHLCFLREPLLLPLGKPQRPLPTVTSLL